MGHAAIRLRELSRKYSGQEMAVFVSPRMTNEEIYLAQKFARIALKTHNVTSFSQLANPDIFTPDVIATATYRDLADAQTILLVNSNLADEHFVVDLIVKRALRKGGRLIYVGPGTNRTAALADVFLECKKEAQGLVVQAIVAEAIRKVGGDPAARPDVTGAVAGLSTEAIEQQTGVEFAAIRQAAEILAGSILKVLVFNRDYRGVRRVHDARLFAAAATALGCSLLPLHDKANSQGLLDMGAQPGWYPGYQSTTSSEVVEALEKEWCVALSDLQPSDTSVAALLAQKKIKVAVIFGEDPLGAEDLPEVIRKGLLAVDFLVVADLFLTRTAQVANIVLPLSSTAETSGTFTNSERRVQRLRRAIPPRPGLEGWELIAGLAAKMGLRFKMNYDSTAQILDEIRRVAPIYRDVVVDSQDTDALWDASRFLLAQPGADGAATAPVVRPASTAALDCVDARFEKWFTGLFAART